MNPSDFSENTRLADVLTEKEQIQIFRYLCLSEDKKALYDSTSIAFPIRKRNSNNFSTLRLLETFSVESSPTFVCDGQMAVRSVLCSNQKIALHGVGFRGPIHCESVYDVTVEVFDDRDSTSLQKLEKIIHAKRNNKFYTYFSEPIILEAKNIECGWDSGHVHVRISLKGANLLIQVLGSSYKDFRIEADGVGFWCRVERFPLAEYIFQKL